MPQQLRFRSQIEPARGGTASGGGAVAAIPDEIATALGGRTQMRVFGTVNGEAIKSSTMVYRGVVYVGIHKEARETFGDEVDFELTRDASPRVLELAPDLEAAMVAEPELRARFDAQAFTRRKEMSDPIRDAVKPETRAARLAEVLATLRNIPV